MDPAAKPGKRPRPASKAPAPLGFDDLTKRPKKKTPKAAKAKKLKKKGDLAARLAAETTSEAPASSSSSASSASSSTTAPSAPPSASSSASPSEKASSEPEATFQSLGVCKPLVDACKALKWEHPTPIQREAIPLALSGRDVIGLAETGSGKTAAFGIPVLQALLDHPQRLFACIMVPTRELAFQIQEQLNALGAAIGCKCAVLVGGVDMMSQAIALARKPHIVVGTPGRMVDHLENTKGFSLRACRYLVLDEADRMLSLDFETAIDKVLRAVPRERRTLLFSATMTSRVAKLQRASLQDPVKVEVSSKYGTVSGLTQRYIFCPHKHKDAHLASLLNDFAGQSSILFVATCAAAQRLALLLKLLGYSSTVLHSKLSQSRRLSALASFRASDKQVLVATDVASRGLDMPSVDLVVNVDVPASAKDYVHRVGRTARAGRAGNVVTIVTQYDVEAYQRVERLLGKKLEEYEQRTDEIASIAGAVNDAARVAASQLKETAAKLHGKGRGGQRRAALAAAEADLAAGDGFSGAADMLSASSAQRRRLGAAVKARRH